MEKEFINPAGLYKHPGYTRIVTVTGPSRLIFMSGQTPSDENYKPVAPGDYRAQYISIMESLELELKAVGASWDDVVHRRTYTLDVDKYLAATRDPTTPKYGNPARPPASTLLGVTRLSNPEFLIEIELMVVTAP